MKTNRTKTKSKLSMPLGELLENYIASRPEMKPVSAASYRFTLRAFEKYLGRKATLADLTEETVNGYVSVRLAKWSQSAAKRDRNSLVVWWRYAARMKLLPPPPIDGIPTIKVRHRNPTAWTLEEMGQLLGVCSKLAGRLRSETDQQGCHWHHIFATGPLMSCWWKSFILFLFDTGTRLSAALEVRTEDLDLTRSLVVLRAQHAKTGVEQVLRLSQQTVAELRALNPQPGKLVWFWGYRRRKLFTDLELILEEAGLPVGRDRKFHCIRKTTATLTAAAGRPDLSQHTLGHTTPTMTRSYIDLRAMPLTSAADVLPRPTWEGCSTPELPPRPIETPRRNGHTPQQPTEKPNGDALSVLAAMSPEQLQALLALAKALGRTD